LDRERNFVLKIVMSGNLFKKMKISISPIWVHLNQLGGSGVAEVGEKGLGGRGIWVEERRQMEVGGGSGGVGVIFSWAMPGTLLV
jgi:hypothetical protein